MFPYKCGILNVFTRTVDIKERREQVWDVWVSLAVHLIMNREG
jgi:hypothetical protein